MSVTIKKLPLTLLTCLLFLSPNVVLSENWSDLVVRDGLWFKKFSDVPFTGKVTGIYQGSIKNGKKDGLWFYYFRTGQLMRKGTLKDGEREGHWVHYHPNGQVMRSGTYKDGEREGPWVFYNETGTVIDSITGTYKNGVKVK